MSDGGAFRTLPPWTSRDCRRGRASMVATRFPYDRAPDRGRASERGSTRGQYDEVAEDYERQVVPRFRPVAERLLRVADIRPGDDVLEVAAGTGGLSRLVAPRLDPSGSLVLTDLS